MRTLYSENKNSNTTIVNGENGTYSMITTTTIGKSRTVEATTYNNADNVIGFNRIVEKNNNKGRRVTTESQSCEEDESYPKEKVQTKTRYNINGKLVEKESTKTYYSEENGNLIEYTEKYYYSYNKNSIKEEKIKKIIAPNSIHLIQQTSSKKIYSSDGKKNEGNNTIKEYNLDNNGNIIRYEYRKVNPSKPVYLYHIRLEHKKDENNPSYYEVTLYDPLRVRRNIDYTTKDENKKECDDNGKNENIRICKDKDGLYSVTFRAYHEEININDEETIFKIIKKQHFSQYASYFGLTAGDNYYKDYEGSEVDEL